MASTSTASSAPLILYGIDASQPTRVISWMLRTKNVPFEYVIVAPGQKKGTRNPDFIQKKNKAAMVPVLEHGQNIITESGSIAVYLAETFQWDDLYPSGKDRAADRAKINTWLHWTHKNSRDFTVGIFAPILRRDIKFVPEQLKIMEANCVKAATFLDDELKTNKFLSGFNQPTIADYAVFADIGQCSKEDLDLFDFTPYPNLSAWMSRMKALPHYAETHTYYDYFKPIVQKVKEEDAIAAKKAKL
jgi:glutathione S-transferase